MNRTELIARVAESQGVDGRTVERIVKGAFDEMAATMARGESVAIHEFGRFNVRGGEMRFGRNVRTGVTIEIPAPRTLQFTTSRLLAERMNRRP